MSDVKNGKTAQKTEDLQEYVFALDIGTRSVIGVVGKQEGAFFNVIATEMMEHPTRAMMDGQIEDIEQVARIATAVKARLEQRVKTKFKNVCVAAAGRSLKTAKASFQIDFSAPESITETRVYELEMGAVTAARESLDAEKEGTRYYCVGHAVIRYYLDDYPFTTILNHRGSVAKVEVIATFLPNEVVDSLCTTMNIVGLDISHLTLEPIAAMNAVIPQELRLLNLALVDIGAGTSDIATSDNGGVSAYTMATVAGDEVTEEIIKKCLVDFSTAERIKHEAAAGLPEISYKDILGFEYTLTLDEVIELLKPAVELLTATICEKIMSVNGKAPMAVFLVGGGSRAPLLCDYIADNLKIDRKKVAVGGNNFIGRVVRTELDLAGPEYATPIGIAMTGAAAGMREGFHVMVNGKKTRIFRSYNVTVMDSLLTCGYPYSKLMGKCGKNVTYTLNGDKKIMRGGMYKPAEITINGVSGAISTMVESGDEIWLVPAVQGVDAEPTLRDITPVPEEYTFYVNEEEQKPEYLICEGDAVIMVPKQPLQSEEKADTEPPLLDEQDGEANVKEEYTMQGGEGEPTEEALAQAKPAYELTQRTDVVKMQKPISIRLNGSMVQLPSKEEGLDYQFIDMLAIVDIDPTKPQGNIILRINDKATSSYLQPIKDGDSVDIFWEGIS
ncbi:MAG: cell division FtsA domain-containing protein [Hydrogenoanaerobacterium sp.]